MLLFMEFSALCALQPQSRPLPQLAYSCNRNDHISCVGAAVVCAPIVCIGIGNDLGDYSGLAVLVGFDLLYDLSAGRLLAAAVMPGSTGVGMSVSLKKVVINVCHDKVIKLYIAGMIYEKNRRRSGHTEIHRNIRIGDNLLIVKSSTRSYRAEFSSRERTWSASHRVRSLRFPREAHISPVRDCLR